MKRSFEAIPTPFFERQSDALPDDAFEQLSKTLRLLSVNPRHPSLQTHEVHGARGEFGGKIFEAYVSKKYRLTWEYGPEPGEITLRNVDNHDECLRRP